MTKIILLAFILLGYQLQAQFMIKGKVLDASSMEVISNVQIALIGSTITTSTDQDGLFNFSSDQDQLILKISHPDYKHQLYPISIKSGTTLDVGYLFLYSSISPIESQRSLEEKDENPYAYFLAHHLKNLPYKAKGMVASQVKLNGVYLTDHVNNTFNWHDWQSIYALGIYKNQVNEINSLFFRSSLEFQLKPSKNKSSSQLYGSFSNSDYNTATRINYASGLSQKGVAFTIMASKKWADEGYYSGTLYDALSAGFALEFEFNKRNSLTMSAHYSPKRYGLTPHITQRTFKALGRSYNPHWGFQNGEKRNASMLKRSMPTFLFSHRYSSRKLKWESGLMFQFGKQSKSYLDFKEADNPFPNYWANLLDIEENPQINWTSLYLDNQNSKEKLALYALIEDVITKKEFKAQTTFNITFNKRLRWLLGGFYWINSSSNYAMPKDLLGANHYHDVNIFHLIGGRPAAHDQGQILKKVGDKSNYYYTHQLNKFDFHSELFWVSPKVDFYLFSQINHLSYQRDGQFLNAHYPLNSLGKSKRLPFVGTTFNTAFKFRFNLWNQLKISAGYQSNPPGLAHSFINIRENNEIVNDLKNDKRWSINLQYQIDHPEIQSHLMAYLSQVKNKTQGSSFFAQTGIGSSFFNESISNIDQQFMGVEWGLTFKITPNIITHIIAGISQNSYTKNAKIALNFDPNSFDQNELTTGLHTNLGEAFIKKYRVPNGPQQIYGLSFEYRHNRRVWATISAVHLSNNYIGLAMHKRSSNFFIDPNTQGLPLENIDPPLARKLLKQEKLPVINTINLGLGKSWKIHKNWIRLSVQINNLFNELHFLNGYEQSRLANYQVLKQDTDLGDLRNFGNKYRYGLGRTFHINLSIKR